MKSFKKAFSVFKLLSVVMAVTIVLTGCTGKQGEQGEKGERGPQGVAGKDGKTPTITINAEGYWVINGEVTSFKATGTDGKNGVNGKDGKDGQTPAITINEEGYWVINGTVTNVKATGENGTNGVNGTDGKDGETPVITINKDGYWVINGKVTEFKATGTDGKNGEDGQTPTITINEEGYWVINGVVTEYKAVADEKETIVMEGDGQTFHMFAPTALSFRSEAPLDEFQEVQINGETVDPSNYTLTEGSTIVTFNIDYLKTLEKTQHQVTVVSDSVSANANFEVLTSELSEFGLYYNQPYVGYLSDWEMNTAFSFNEEGIVSMLDLDMGFLLEGTYTIVNNTITLVFEDGEEEIVFTLTVNPTGFYLNELGATFTFNNEAFIADEEYIYVYNEELGGYEVNTFNKTKSEYGVIRTGVNGYPTVKLGGHMFQYNDNLIIAPKIPDSVTSIGEYAFSECTNLTSITIPDSVTSIEERAFYYSGLTNITIPDSVTSIEDKAFAYTELTSITIPDSVTSIGEYAFWGCSSLTSITIPDSVTSIGESVFSGCKNLESVTIGKGITRIESNMFDGCTNLTSITIPDSVISIGNRAFFSTGLTSITIPDSVTSIGDYVFGYVELRTINYKGTEAEWDAIEKGSAWDEYTQLDKVINYNYVG